MFSISLVDAILLIVLFILFQLDLYLTVIGQSMNNKYYAKYFIRETYELNPLWRKSVEKGKKFLFRRFLLTTLSILLVLLLFSLNTTVSEIVLGGGFILYVVINLGHIRNILTFQYLKNHPDELEGSIKVSLAYSLQINFLSNLTTFFLIFILTLIIPNPYLIGGSGVLFFFLIFVKLLQWRVRRKMKSLNKAVT